jgi:mannose-6-phosphate isomerase-like protein (cupin superfamily)
MADYTIRNLKEIEDSAVKGGLSPNLEARFARGALETEQLAISYQRLAPDFRGPFAHRHAQQEEIYVVLGGAGRVKVDDEVVELKQWDAIRVPASTVREFESGPDGLELLAIGAPMGKDNDAELIQEWWTE